MAAITLDMGTHALARLNYVCSTLTVERRSQFDTKKNLRIEIRVVCDL